MDAASTFKGVRSVTCTGRLSHKVQIIFIIALIVRYFIIASLIQSVC